MQEPFLDNTQERIPDHYLSSLSTEQNYTPTPKKQLTKLSQPFLCSNCGYAIHSKTKKIRGVTPWLLCGGMAMIGCCLGCCLIPFCIEGLKDVEHRCPKCDYIIGIKKYI